MASESLCVKYNRWFNHLCNQLVQKSPEERPEKQGFLKTSQYIALLGGVTNKENLPELSHFNVLKLLQDKAYEHLKRKNIFLSELNFTR